MKLSNSSKSDPGFWPSKKVHIGCESILKHCQLSWQEPTTALQLGFHFNNLGFSCAAPQATGSNEFERILHNSKRVEPGFCHAV